MNFENEWQTGLEIKETIGRCRTTTERELVFKGAVASPFFPRFPFSARAPWSFWLSPSTSFRAVKQTRERGKETKLLQRSQKWLSPIGLFLSRPEFSFIPSAFPRRDRQCVVRLQLSICNGSNLINYRSSLIIFDNSILLIRIKQ